MKESSFYTSHLSRINSIILSLSLLILFFSCSQKTDIAILGYGDGTKIVFNVNGIADIAETVQKIGKKSSITSSARSTIDLNPLGLDHNRYGFTASVQAKEEKIAISKPVPQNLNIIAASTPMEEGKTYRILVYNKSTGAFWRTIQATSKTPIELDAQAGVTYTWYAYSHNDNSTLPEPANTTNPSIPTEINKDLLYATGEITIPTTGGHTPENPGYYRIPITFRHKVAQVSVKINTKNLALYAKINSIKASFRQNDYLKKGNFHLKDSSVTDLEHVPTKVIFEQTYTNIGADTLAHSLEANYYTLDPASVASYIVDIEDLEVTFQNVLPEIATVNLATFFPEPNLRPSFTFTFANPDFGKNLIGEANLQYVPYAKKILHYSDNSTYGYSAQRGPSWDFLSAEQNFGLIEPNNSLYPYLPGGSRVRMQRWDGATGTTASNHTINQGTTLINLIADDPDIIIMGYRSGAAIPTSTRAQVAQALVNYINRKGVVVMMNEQIEDTKAVLDLLLGAPVTAARFSSAGALYPLPAATPGNANDPILNGIFGDVRGQLWGEDASTTNGVTGISTGAPVTVYSYGQAINRAINATDATRVTMLRHNNRHFFWVGDGGFISYNGGVDQIICPFNYDVPTKKPLPKPYGNSGGNPNVPARSRSVYNSVIFGNVMVWAALNAEYDGVTKWKYDTRP